jgi:hypothetical protein
MYVEFDLPEVPLHDASLRQYWLKILSIRSPSDRYQINALTNTYIRLVEAALYEYTEGSRSVREFWGTHTSFNLGAMHRSTHHFEACISNMYRATNCFCRLRRDRLHDPVAMSLSQHRFKFATDGVANRLGTIRNEIHHLEEIVMQGRIGDGQPFALKADGPEVPHATERNQTIKTIDRLIIGSSEITFRELAKWLDEMGLAASRIADALPSSS